MYVCMYVCPYVCMYNYVSLYTCSSQLITKAGFDTDKIVNYMNWFWIGCSEFAVDLIRRKRGV